MVAKVKWYNALKEYGYATAPGVRGDILLRSHHISPTVDCLLPGDEITCTLIPPNRVKPNSIRPTYGPQATRIELRRRR